MSHYFAIGLLESDCLKGLFLTPHMINIEHLNSLKLRTKTFWYSSKTQTSAYFSIIVGCCFVNNTLICTELDCVRRKRKITCKRKPTPICNLFNIHYTIVEYILLIRKPKHVINIAPQHLTLGVHRCPLYGVYCACVRFGLIGCYAISVLTLVECGRAVFCAWFI